MSQRGKTSPDSTPGSFSPATGRTSRVQVEPDAAETPVVSRYVTDLAANGAIDAAERLATSRARLADPTTPVADLIHHTHSAIAHDAAHQVFSTAHKLIEGGATQDALREWAINGVCEPPRDTWSGRNNDSRRVEHEARHKALTTFITATAPPRTR